MIYALPPRPPAFRVLAFYSMKEPDHVAFAQNAMVPAGRDGDDKVLVVRQLLTSFSAVQETSRNLLNVTGATRSKDPDPSSRGT